MSKVKFIIGDKPYSYESEIVIINPAALETILHEEVASKVKQLKQSGKAHGIVRDIEIVDDTGITATIKDFSEIGNIEVELSKT